MQWRGGAGCTVHKYAVNMRCLNSISTAKYRKAQVCGQYVVQSNIWTTFSLDSIAKHCTVSHSIALQLNCILQTAYLYSVHCSCLVTMSILIKTRLECRGERVLGSWTGWQRCSSSPATFKCQHIWSGSYGRSFFHLNCINIFRVGKYCRRFLL